MDDATGCGLSKIWFLPNLFRESCGWHDRMYEDMYRGGFEQLPSSRSVDRVFYEKMRFEAGSWWQREVLSRVFWGVARLYGMVKWNRK